ncbi:uncharacterized protein LOC127438652 [Myxocyprinus asiaticus]|uniref:uncharacterized protein LOC127438652 n=1 Tax=Myxocyprinus asiaticus TaxID=70543 RepID=UPI0022237DBE|nr:uncharacterized protein LOC127438652 [Myxocyprinus asiaticus]
MQLVWTKVSRMLNSDIYMNVARSIWLNTKLCINKSPFCWTEWIEKGVATLGDLYENGALRSFENIIQRFGIPRAQFFRKRKVIHIWDGMTKIESLTHLGWHEEEISIIINANSSRSAGFKPGSLKSPFIQSSDFTPRFNVPIFTEEFLDQNKVRKAELRRMRKANVEFGSRMPCCRSTLPTCLAPKSDWKLSWARMSYAYRLYSATYRRLYRHWSAAWPLCPYQARTRTRPLEHWTHT